MLSVTRDRSLETLTAEDFRGHRGSRFKLTGQAPGSGSAVSLDAELADVNESVPGATGAYRTPFSVVFHGPPEPVLPQGIYRLEAEHFGSMELFLVPVGPQAGPPGAPVAMGYEAVFG